MDSMDPGIRIRNSLNANTSLSEVEPAVREPFDGIADRVSLRLQLCGPTTVYAFEAWSVGRTRAGIEMRAIPANNPRTRLRPTLVGLGALHKLPISPGRFSTYTLSVSKA